MQESIGIPRTFAVDPTTASRLRRWTMFAARLVFWVLALLTLIALALDLGAYRKEIKIAGPFVADTNPARHSLMLAVPQEAPAAWWRQPLLGDTNEKPQESNLELQIDGREMWPPHAMHETIREGKSAGFSHWGSNVIFSLPPGVKNAPEITAILRYRVFPRAWVTYVLAISSALLGLLLYHRTLRLFLSRNPRLLRAVLTTPYFILLALCGVGLLGSAAYVASSIHALATGWALPTTAIIRGSPVGQWAARNEPYLGDLLLMVAGIGASVTWVAGPKATRWEAVRTNEQFLRPILAWCGFPIVACAFVFCISAMWAGTPRPGDPHISSIGGLVPFSDAANYLTAAHDQVKDGYWNFVALRRPMAAAFRSVLLIFANFSLQFMLILQACLIAGALCFATHAVVKWRGVWAGTAFFALAYIYNRAFIATPLTESLGLFWALLSIPFFIEAFVGASVKPALVAFAMTTVALMTRMGSMFTIPALLLWLVWQFGQGVRGKLRIFAVATCILLSVLGLNSLLQKAYGTGVASATANFAYTLCGLTMGTPWNGCISKLSPEQQNLTGGESALTTNLYSLAWDNFKAEPSIFFNRLADGAKEFAVQFPDVIWNGFGAVPQPNWLWRNLLTAIALIGLAYSATHRANAAERTFWALLWISIVASASMVYFDDGGRALAASHPLIALFFAIGIISPVQPPAARPSRSLARYGSIGLIVTAVLLVCIPWAAHRLFPTGFMLGDHLLEKDGEAFVFGGRRMSGFLVVADGLPLRDDIPSVHLADFDFLVGQSSVERFQGLIHPVTPPLPFGFIFAPRLEKGALSNLQYIVPAEVLERYDVPAWHFQLKHWGDTPPAGGGSHYWFYVTKAEPWS